MFTHVLNLFLGLCMQVLGVYWVDFGSSNIGGEINKPRPAIVVSRVSKKDNTLIVIPLTSKKPDEKYRGGFTLDNRKYNSTAKYKSSFVKVRKMREIDKSRVIGKICYTLDDEDITKLIQAVKRVIEIGL